MSLDDADIGLGPLAALSEGQRRIAHLVVILALLAALALVYIIRRRVRRREQKRGRIPEDG